MPEFDVQLSKVIYANVVVEADNEDEAVELAVQEADSNLTGEDGWDVDDVNEIENEYSPGYGPDDDGDSGEDPEDNEVD